MSRKERDVSEMELGEHKGWVEGLDKREEGEELRTGEGGSTDAIIDITAVELGCGSGELGEDLSLNMADEKVGIVGAHSGSHRHARNLLIDLTGEREAVESED